MQLFREFFRSWRKKIKNSQKIPGTIYSRQLIIEKFTDKYKVEVIYYLDYGPVGIISEPNGLMTIPKNEMECEKNNIVYIPYYPNIPPI